VSARVFAEYVMAMTLIGPAPYEAVMRSVVRGVAWSQRCRRRWSTRTNAGIFAAHSRLRIVSSRALFASIFHYGCAMAPPEARRGRLATPVAW
jgi:hypothetical protein